MAFHGKQEGEDSMRTRRPERLSFLIVRMKWCRGYIRLIHVGSSDSPSFITFVHECHHLIVAFHNEFRQVLDVRP